MSARTVEGDCRFYKDFAPDGADVLAAGGAEGKRVFAAMMDMGKIDIAKIEAARRG